MYGEPESECEEPELDTGHHPGFVSGDGTGWGRGRVLETGMTVSRGVRLLTFLVPCFALSSCFLIRVPVETAGTVVSSGARVAEKTAVTGVQVAGKAAGAVIDGKVPTTNRSVWSAFR